ncbi:MAG: T9SS type A sorting domain-containing protein [Candidatus Kapaibacterium sp.]
MRQSGRLHPTGLGLFCFILLTFPSFLPTSGLMLSAQDFDYTRMARPDLDEEYEIDREKADWLRYVVSGPISNQNNLFLNSNTIVEPAVNPPPQNESSIAISPVDPNFLIASAVDSRPGAWVYISRDGGQTWENKSLGVVNQTWQSGNDPSVGFDHDGNAYVMYGAFPRPFSGESGVYIAKSTDQGVNWTPHIKVIEHKGVMTPDSAFEDKYYIEIDRSTTSPYRGWMYTPWKRVTDRDSATEIVFTRSTDGGLTWSEPVGVSPRKSGTSTHITFGQSFPLVKTGANGEIYAVWNDGPARSIGFAKSTDGGDTWTPPSYPVSGYEYLGTERYLKNSAGDTTDKYHVLKGVFRAETYPTIAVDYSNSSRRGWVYLCWSAGRTPEIYFIRSTDNGETWSSPKIIHSKLFGDQWWPWISVDETNGDIGVMYSDSRDDPENIMINTYVSYSSDGGDTWIDRKATDAVSDFRDNPFVDQVFAGDYSGNAFRDGKIYPSFLDTRDDNDVYTAIVDIRKPLPVENFRVGSRIDALTEARLTWKNPPLETAFGLPIDDYTLVLERDGQLLAELPSGTTEYVEGGLTLEQEYVYSIRVVVDSDSSVWRDVDFRSGGAKLPGSPRIGVNVQYEPTVSTFLRLPTTRADEVTPLTNLAGLRIYRDGVFLRQEELNPTDTGELLKVDDTPAERGYYRYTFTTVDSDSPANESPLSDTVILFAGLPANYIMNFESPNKPRFLYTGEWDTTANFFDSAPWSLTDSPNGDYKPRQQSTMQLFPIAGLPEVSVQFNHVCIVLPGDSAILEVSYDSTKTWQPLATWQSTDNALWNDRSADDGDWLPAEVGTVVDFRALAFFRFRLVTSSLSNADGWYIDDLMVLGVDLGVDNREENLLEAQIRPNPVRNSASLSFNLKTPSDISLTIVDQLGREPIGRINGFYSAGKHDLLIGTSELPNGIYFWRLETSTGRADGRIIVVR